MRCSLVPEHTGPHCGVTEDKVAYWGGGGPSSWTRP